jgi:hypothetical protein
MITSLLALAGAAHRPQLVDHAVRQRDHVAALAVQASFSFRFLEQRRLNGGEGRRIDFCMALIANQGEASIGRGIGGFG